MHKILYKVMSSNINSNKFSQQLSRIWNANRLGLQVNKEEVEDSPLVYKVGVLCKEAILVVVCKEAILVVACKGAKLVVVCKGDILVVVCKVDFRIASKEHQLVCNLVNR